MERGRGRGRERISLSLSHSASVCVGGVCGCVCVCVCVCKRMRGLCRRYGDSRKCSLTISFLHSLLPPSPSPLSLPLAELYCPRWHERGWNVTHTQRGRQRGRQREMKRIERDEECVCVCARARARLQLWCVVKTSTRQASFTTTHKQTCIPGRHPELPPLLHTHKHTYPAGFLLHKELFAALLHYLD